MLYTAGSALGEPGKAAAGVYITDEAGVCIEEISQPLGNGTRDFAAYYAVLLALQLLQKNHYPNTNQVTYTISLSNTFVYEQLVGKRPMKEPGLVPLFIEIHNLRIESFPDILFKGVADSENQKASDLVAQQLKF